MLATVAVLLALVSTGTYDSLRGAAPQYGNRHLLADRNGERIAVVDELGRIKYSLQTPKLAGARLLESGNILVRHGSSRLTQLDPAGKLVWSYPPTGQRDQAAPVDAFWPLANHHVAVLRAGDSKVDEIDLAGDIASTIQFADALPMSEGTWQLRTTVTGNLVVFQIGQHFLREYDSRGSALRKQIFEQPVRDVIGLPNGNYLLAVDADVPVLEVNPAGYLVWQLGKNELPGVKLGIVTSVQRLASGNTVITSSSADGGGKGVALELTHAKQLVWQITEAEEVQAIDFASSIEFGRLERPAIQAAQEPTLLRNPIVITHPGLVQLPKDYRADGTAIIVAAPNVTIDGQGHVVEFNASGRSNLAGIHLYTGDWVEMDRQHAGSMQRGGQEHRNVKLKNIILRQVTSAGRVTGVYGHRGNEAEISDCIIECSGSDSRTIHFPSGACLLKNNVLLLDQLTTEDRHAGPSNVSCPGVTATNNIVWGGNSGFSVVGSSGGELSRNVISHYMHSTNGYGIWAYRCDNLIARDNLILPLDGRGILLNGKQSGDTAGGNSNLLERNVMLSWNRANEEFGDALNACGVRTRYFTRGNIVRDNTMLSVAGGRYTGASGLYLTNQEPDGRNEFSGNRIYTLLLDEPRSADHYAKAITLEGQGVAGSSNDRIVDNLLFSNHYFFGLGGPDGPCLEDQPMIDNRLKWVNGTEAVDDFESAIHSKLKQIGRTDDPWANWIVGKVERAIEEVRQAPIHASRKTFYTGFWTFDVRATVLTTRDEVPRFTVDDVLLDHTQYIQSRELHIGRRLRVQAVQDGRPMPNTELRVATTNDLNWSRRTRTDDDGFFSLDQVFYSLVQTGGEITRIENPAMRIFAGERSVRLKQSATPGQLKF